LIGPPAWGELPVKAMCTLSPVRVRLIFSSYGPLPTPSSQMWSVKESVRPSSKTIDSSTFIAS